MKAINLTLSVLFALFAIVQYNDPDPWSWIALYGFVALISGLAAFGIYRKWAVLAGIGVCLVWMATLLPDFVNWIKMGMPTITGQMKATEPHIELTREFLGLLIALAALGWHLYKSGPVGGGSKTLKTESL